MFVTIGINLLHLLRRIAVWDLQQGQQAVLVSVKKLVLSLLLVVYKEKFLQSYIGIFLFWEIFSGIVFASV